jgi:ABC-2 type transport system permease protein
MMLPQSPAHFHGPLAHHWTVIASTCNAYLKRSNAYLIDVIRWPLFPLMLYATWWIAYDVSGQQQIDGAGVAGYLLVGMVGLITWTSTIWASGYAIEYERSGGTSAALFLSPASRVAVILGYGLGSLLWMLPALVVVALLALATGARFSVADPLAPIAAMAAVVVASLATGFAFASLFVLSRRANLVANFLQLPIYLLAGFIAPREALPDWLRPLSDALPVSHAIDALRAGALHGASLAEIAAPLAMTLATSAAFAIVGAISLRRVEYAAKRSGQLDLY